jgi:hypothetical protein
MISADGSKRSAPLIRWLIALKVCFCDEIDLPLWVGSAVQLFRKRTFGAASGSGQP